MGEDEHVTVDLSDELPDEPAQDLPDEPARELPDEPASPRGSLLSRLKREPDPVRAAKRRLRAAERRVKRTRRRETKRFTAAARRGRRRLIIAGSAIVALIAFVLLGAFTPLMSITDIRVEGAKSVKSEDIESALAKFEGVPLALVDEGDVLRALEGFPLIQRFAVERVPPHTLIVRVEERVAAIAIERDGKLRLYDAAGVVMREVDERPEGVPLGKDRVADTSSKSFREASRIVRDMPSDLRASLQSVTSKTGQDVTFTLTSGVEVFWGNANNTKRKSLVLEQMIESLGKRPITHIDVSSVDAPVFR